MEGSQVLDDSAFSDEFCRFLQTSVPSVDAAELLLALAGDPDRWWQPVELGDSLEQFRSAGLLETGPDGRVRYSAQDGRVAAHVRMLAQAYKERPVTLFRLIYALRAPNIAVDRNLSRRRGR